jgi:hypothetical protein
MTEISLSHGGGFELIFGFDLADLKNSVKI